MATPPRPYIYPREILAAPTGNDWSKFLGTTDPTLQEYRLWDICKTVSDTSDQICRSKLMVQATDNKDYVLRASINTEQAITLERERAIVDEYGNLVFLVTYRPIITVTDMTYIAAPGNGMTLGAPFHVPIQDMYWEDRKISAEGNFGWGVGSYYSGWGTGLWGGYAAVPLRVSVTYINGFPNTMLVGDVEADDTSIEVEDATGIVAGNQLNLYDIPFEIVEVDASYDGVSTTIPLAYSLSYDHTSGLRVSTLDSNHRQAMIWLVMDLMQMRSQQGVVAARAIPGFSGQGHAVPLGASDYYMKATEYLGRYILTP